MTFADCDTARLDALAVFFRNVYHPGYRLGNDQALLKWQFGRPQSGLEPAGRVHVKLALSGDDIRACIGYIPVEFSVAGTIQRAAWTANWVVAPADRRLGLGPLLLRELIREFDAVLSVGLDPDAREMLPRMGWTDFGDLARYVGVLDVMAARSLTETGELEWPVPPRPQAGDAALVASDALVLGDDATRLWDRVHGQRDAGTRRTAAFLNWRYASHPSFTYRYLTRRSGTELEALAIYRIELVKNTSIHVGRIVELIADDELKRGVLAGLMADARAHGVAAVDFFTAGRLDRQLFEGAGFLPGNLEPASRIPLVFQPIVRGRTGIRFMADVSKLSNLSDVRGWYATKGDGDQDRPN